MHTGEPLRGKFPQGRPPNYVTEEIHMKKLLAVLLLLSMLASMLVITPAAAVEGDWITLRQANDYHEVDPETGEEPPYQAAPGYTYTDEGFTTVPADYTGTCPYFNIRSKDKYDLKDGLYLQIRVDDFSYRGPEGNADEWILFSLWDSENIAPGQSGFGNGWFGLIRGSGGGQDASFEGETVTPVLDDQGREIYTLEVEWDGSQYNFSLNGVHVAKSATITNTLNNTDKSGNFYVGISIQSTVKDGVAALSILKFGTSEKDATTPVGTDSAEPEPNNNITAPMMDPANIGENQPAVYWDATLYKNVSGQALDFLAMGNNSYRVTASDANGFFTWTVRKDISYAIEDFPVFAIMVKDYWKSGTLWYFCGDIVGPTAGSHISFNAYDGEYFGDGYEDYTLVLVELDGMAEGRINGFRIDFNGMDIVNEPEFEICYMGCFRSWDEAAAYGNRFLTGEEEVPTEEPTEAPTTDETEAPTEDSTPDNGGDATEAPTDEGYGEPQPTFPGDTMPTEAKGCGSIMSFGAAAVLCAMAAAVVLRKKD